MNKHAAWRQTLYRIIFEADTSAGKRFDIALLVLIVLSIALVMIESVPRIHAIPTGIVSVEMSRTFNEATDKDKKCTHCGEPRHAPEANFLPHLRQKTERLKGPNPENAYL